MSGSLRHFFSSDGQIVMLLPGSWISQSRRACAMNINALQEPRVSGRAAHAHTQEVRPGVTQPTWRGRPL